MRPLKLKFTGLRSYRTEQVIDFSDVDLMAIIGNTGAGKSSILEAICFALYGSCTWNKKSSKSLIAADGDGTLQVEFTFHVKDQTWQVVRTASVSRAARHHLKCLDTGDEYDAHDVVNDRIRKLVGLDVDTFLKAVVLPQGKFQELLQSSEAERTRLLKSLLGLDVLTSVREKAVEAHERLRGLLNEAEGERLKLLSDPAGVIEAASRRIGEEEEHAARLERAKESIGAARARRDRAAAHAEELRTAGSVAIAGRDSLLAARFAELIDADERIQADLTAAGKQKEQCDLRLGECKDALAAAEEEGVGVAGTATAISVLGGMAEAIPALLAERSALDGRWAEIEGLKAVFAARPGTRAELTGTLDDVRITSGTAQEEFAAAKTKLERTLALLHTVRQTTAALARTAGAVEGTRGELTAVEEKLEEADHESEKAAVALTSAEAALTAVHRTNSAAHAAAASEPGDPCPVCEQALPTDFQRPVEGAAEDAEKLVAAAKRRCINAAKAVRDLTGRHGEARALLDRAIENADTATREHDAAMVAIQGELGDVLLESGDEELLAPLREQAAKTEKAKDAADAAVRAAESDVSLHDAGTVTAKAELRRAEQDYLGIERAVRDRAEKLKTDNRSLAAIFRIEGDLIVDAVAASAAKAETQQATLAKVTEEIAALDQQLADLSRDVERLWRKRRKEVEEPRQSLAEDVVLLCQRIFTAARLVGFADLPERGEAGLAGEARWAASLMTASARVAEQCERQAADQDGLAETAGQEITATRVGVNVATDDELEAALHKALVEGEVARRERKRAQEQLPRSEDLDRRIAAARPVVTGLRELAGVLTDGKFVADVVRRKQGELLARADANLASLTNNRFGFAEKFDITDGDTGQARDVKTLSGGETFQASLALALALVEITSQNRGRVEALFLDEGFGTLDSNVLADALDALQHNVGANRLVAVISHMHDVAMSFERILTVTKSPRGSEVRWLAAEERERLVSDEWTSGLLA